MKTFKTSPGVDRFETGGPGGVQLVIEAGKPLSTDDPAVISVLENSGAHALTISDAATTAAGPKSDKKQEGGDE